MSSRVYIRVFAHFLAIRRKRDLLFKPAVLLLMVLAVRCLAEGLLFGIDPAQFWQEMLISSLVGSPFLILGMILVTDMETLQGELETLATTDPLTGLLNRRAFLQATNKAKSDGENGILMIADADHFKCINDKFGHATGDLALQEIAHALCDHVATQGYVGRIGGEEFALYIPDGATPDVNEFGDIVTGPHQVPFFDGADQLNVTMSVGATISPASETVEEALVRADMALYRAKAEGRARLIMYDYRVDHPHAA